MKRTRSFWRVSARVVVLSALVLGMTAGIAFAATLVGSQNPDVINGTPAADEIRGLGGGDTLTGNAGNDVIEGGNGADTINGNAGDDILEGDDGADTIDGGSGDDDIQGNDGADILTGGGGQDNIEGGDGPDTIYAATAESAQGADTIDCGSGYDTVFASPNDTVSGDCENVTRLEPTSALMQCQQELAAAGLTAPTGANYILGTAGDDDLSLQITSGVDVICGFGGRDTVNALLGGDIFLGGADDDSVSNMILGTFDGGEGNDVVTFLSGGTFNGGNGCDAVVIPGAGTFNPGDQSTCIG